MILVLCCTAFTGPSVLFYDFLEFLSFINGMNVPMKSKIKVLQNSSHQIVRYFFKLFFILLDQDAKSA